MMNRDMRKLRKDPTIPPSAATVITSTTNAFPVSPRIGNTNADSRVNSRNRTSPKSHGAGALGLDSDSGASSISSAPLNAPISSTSGSNTSPNTSTATAALSSAAIGGPGSILTGGAGNSGIGGATSGSILGYGNGNNYKSSGGNPANSRHVKKISNFGPQSFKFDTNGAISALAASPDFSLVAVNGRDVLKILSVTDHSAEEKIVLKSSRSNFGGSTIDVKWGPTTGRDAKIATLGTNGPIVIWDIGNHNKIERVFKEHTRQVNSICFSPQDPNLLLSGASDHTMRLWDLRVRNRPGSILDAKETVREVQFSPLNVNEIAAGYESGNVQRWDLRNLGSTDKRFMAHMGFVTSLDYHPNGRFLATGGRDKNIKIWDLEDEKKREMYTIPTIQLTCKVQWRPNKPYQLAACFKDESTVQIFDVRRPFVPQHVLTHHDKNVAALLWRDSDTLFTVSNDKTFASTLIKGQPFSADLLPSGKATMNCYGQLAFTVASKSNPESFEKDLITKPGRPNAKPVALDGSSDVTVYRTRQTGGVFDCELFNHKAFIFCAQNYSIDCTNIRESCEHNANVAWHANRYRDSQTWTAIKLFYSDMTDPAAVISQDTISGETTDINTKADNQGLDGNDHDSDISEAHQPKPAIPSLFAIKVKEAPIKRIWSHEETVKNMLEYYAEQGEVQMCVTILLVLSNEELPEFSRSQQWFASYIDLLSRFKLWSIATAVSQACKDPSIHAMNQDSTTIQTSCSSCMKPLPATRSPTSTGFWACDRCRKVLSSCSVCHKTVRGIFTWCSHCSHGFHLHHAQEWFSQSAECPTGCGHQCFPEMLTIQLEQEQQQNAISDQPFDNDTLYEHSVTHTLLDQTPYPLHVHYRGSEISDGKGSSPLLTT